MIQIVSARPYLDREGNEQTAFVYAADKQILLPSLGAVFEKWAAVVEMLPEEERHNNFYCLAHHSGFEGASKPSRSKITFEYQSAIAFDIDNAETDKGLKYGQIVADILGCPLDNMIVVNSGGGVHVLFNLRYPIRNSKYFDENASHYKAILGKINKGMEDQGLKGKADPKIFDAARVLRLPGTINRKKGREDTLCTLLQNSKAVLDFDITVVSGLGQLERENISPAEVRRLYPTPDFKEIVKECQFMATALEKPETLHEPDLFDAYSILACMDKEARVSHGGAMVTAKELGKALFIAASNGVSKSLKTVSFDEKWAQSSEYGGRKCSTIDQRWERGCKGCPHYQMVPTPLALKSREHIGSEQTGYWVIGDKGQPKYPHYEDLAKVYKREHNYLTTRDERIFAFLGTHYIHHSPLLAKAWIEKKVRPSEPLRETQRNEFVSKIQVLGAISHEEEDELFTNKTHGKINFKNGVLDIVTGQLKKHSSEYGFQYCLPYDFNPDESSEVFIDWLAVITQDRVEIMESILDLMAYMLWPNYDDHVFGFFIGEGKNGKSTLMHIMQEMVGKGNFSSVSIQQLASNRFAPASLEGKLVNLSEESSGSELSYEEMNVIKTLSAGGELFVEEKGKQGYTFRNKAKLIFSANKPPKFLEQGMALKRRLLVLPFDYTIDVTDSTVEDKLIKQVPAILSMLVRRIQENVKVNGGRFVVSRGGSAAGAAQRYIFSIGNTALDWAKENLESSLDIPQASYITVSDAYGAYKIWSDEQGFRNPLTQPNFSRAMHEFFLTKAVSETEKRRKIAGKSTRVFPRTRFKKEDFSESEA